jgi:hypothetical protein
LFHRAVHIIIGGQKVMRKSRGHFVCLQSARGLAHSPGRFALYASRRETPRVLDCGGPPPLFPEAYPTVPKLTGPALSSRRFL